MSALADIRARLGGVYVTRRAALVALAPVPVVVWLPGAWPWVVAFVWLAAHAALVQRDIALAPGPDALAAERELPVKLSVGVANPVTLTVHLASARSARITVRETPPAGFAGERAVGPVAIPPRGEWAHRFAFTPPARGRFEFGPATARSAGPLGLAGRQFALCAGETAKVYPDITAVHTYALLARRGTLHEIGVRAARFAGVGTEFESLRDYLDGDDYRDIDWKATARRGVPVVRNFEAERSQTIVLAVDAGRLMTPYVGALTKLDRAVNAALLLAYLATRSGDNVGLLVFGRDVHTFVAPKKGHRQFLAILEALYTVEGAVEEPDYAAALRYLSTRVRRRALVVLFTELVGTEPSRRLLGVLQAMSRRHLPLVMTQRNREVERTAAEFPAEETDVFRAAVAADLVHDKAAALASLSAAGSLVVDVEPERLSTAAVNRYLEVKARGRL